jgi:probable HAF family extracellular repeat protein
MSARVRDACRLTIAFVLLGLAGWGCAGEPATAPSFARASAGGGRGPAVRSTNPKFAAQGITLDVRVLGSGFDQGSRAVWALNRDTAFATTKVKTNSTDFVSSTELVANITIGADATIDLYDVIVLTAGGKKGIGIELFEVTTEIIDLGAGLNSTATAVNDLGQVVGRGGAGSGAFLWQDGTLTDLGVLPGMTSSQAEDINASGQVVGSSGNGSVYSAFIWTAGGGMQALGTLGGCCSQATAINDLGQVVGYSNVPGDAAAHAFVWTLAGGMQDIHDFSGGTTFPWDINDQGQVAGVYFPNGTNGGSQGSFTGTITGGLQVLGTTLDGAEALGINAAGVIVGWSAPAAGELNQAYRWTGSVKNYLGTLGGASSVAMAVNDAGEVVGRSDTGIRRSGALQHVAFLWTVGEGMKSLGLSSGTDYGQAWDINESGWVVGEVWQARGSSRATLWLRR